MSAATSPADHVVRIRDQLGPCVLLPIPLGEKGPRTKDWQKLTPADMSPYLASLNHGHNIGVSLGAASEGLCTIDADNEEFLESFLSLNPAFRESLISLGARGGNVWLRIQGQFPPSGKLKLDNKPWGEWRADGNQTVVYGKHPSGCEYRNNGKRPLEIEFEKIRWPDGLGAPWKANAPQNTSTVSESHYTPNDAGRADRFVARYGQDIRFVPERALWLVWDSDRWRVDRDGALERLAVKMSRDLLSEAARIPGTDDIAAKRRASACQEGLGCGDRRNISDYLALAQVDRRILLPAERLDSDSWLVAGANAIIDLKTGIVRAYSREDFITRTLGCEVDPEATCPRWDNFMEEVFPDHKLRHYVHKAAGYSLTGLTTEHHFMFLHGRGANGKSTFLEILVAAFGDYAGRAGSRLIYATDHHGTPDDEIAELFGRRLIIASETAEGVRLQEGLLKDITGGDTLRGCRKYEHGFNFQSSAKLWLAGNHKPAIRGTDDGIWRRVRLVPFERQFGPEERDENLRSKLLAELPGIINWLAQGCLLWQREGLTPPEIVRSAVADYRSEEDTLADFIEECTREDKDSNTSHSELFKAYQQWSAEMGIKFPLSSKLLAKRLRERGWRDVRTAESKCVWRGIALEE